MQPHPVLRDSGRLPVETDLRVVATAGVWSAGDCAAVPDLTSPGTTTPPTAQHAVRQARHLADNLTAVLRGEPAQPYAHRYVGSVASLGLHQGVAELYGVRLRGTTAWMLHRTYHLAQMPTWNRKVRISLDWALASLFQRDPVAFGPVTRTAGSTRSTRR